jgi:hypothetical protein
MQGIFSAPRGRSVEAFGLTLVAAALSVRNLLLDRSIKLTRYELIPIARSDSLPET